MASIQHRQRADGTVAYRVMFRQNGRLASETFDAPEQADYFANLVERIGPAAARAKRDKAGSTTPTLPKVLEDYIAQAPDLTPGTAADYRRMLDRSGMTDALGGLPVDLIDRRDIEAWVKTRSQTISEKTGQKIAPKTVRNEHGILSTLLEHAVFRQWAPTNPAKGVRLPKRVPADILIPSTEEFLKIHARIGDRYKPLVWLLGATGLRWGEATALQWRHIGPTWVQVAQAWKRGEKGSPELGAPKTPRSRRRVETSPTTIASLGKRGKPDEYVFTNSQGRPVNHWTFLSCHWRPACEGIDPRPDPHDLRHFAASYMLSQGADIFEVSRALGHESIKTTTSVYGHLVPSRTRPTVVHAANLERLLDA